MIGWSQCPVDPNIVPFASTAALSRSCRVDDHTVLVGDGCGSSSAGSNSSASGYAVGRGTVLVAAAN